MENKLDKIVSLCKRRGFVFQGSEIYGGLSGVWDYGPLGTLLKENIKSLWLKMFRDSRDDVYPFDASIIMNPKVWEASGHVAGFADSLDGGEMFNVMFKTSVGVGEEAITSYLRPETAQGMFVNFKNLQDSFHPKIPFGLAQIGKAFRNEISPRDFIFRSREFEQMEVEYFVQERDWEKFFQEWLETMRAFGKKLGIKQIFEVDVLENDRAHYSKRTIDFEFDYPFGRKELWGLAYRTDFDLKAHSISSGINLEYFDEENGDRFTPHVIEPSFGVDRTILATLISAYTEDELGGEKRVVLRFHPLIAPIKIAVFPLVKNKENVVSKAQEVFGALKKKFGAVVFDDNGNIGKRYRRQDEIGTPWCVTIDYQTLEDETVTIRDRDTGEQIRHPIDELPKYFAERLV